MARTLTVKDAYAVMNLLVKQATGQQAIAVTDLSSFVSAGERVLATGTENVLNSLSLVINRTLVASRPYRARLDLMEEVNTGLYSSRIRKISYYASDALPSGDFNTDLYTNFAKGYTNGQNTQANPNSTKSQWEQHPKYPLEMNFAGSSTWQYCITRYEDQLQAAFRSPEDFNAFISGWMVESANDIESQREAWNRMNLLNKIASVYDMSAVMPGSVVNLTAAFNAKFGTSYTSADLMSTHLKEFLAFFVSVVKTTSKFMRNRTTKYHWTPAKQDAAGNNLALLRHTPKDRQRLYLYQPLFIESESLVLPEIFNPVYLDIEQYQGVDYWQTQDAGMEINVTPAVVNTATGVQQAGDPVNVKVVGMLTDVDGLMTNFQAEIARSTPVEARKGYRNIWTTFLRNNMCDNTENAVIFVMEDEETPSGVRLNVLNDASDSQEFSYYYLESFEGDSPVFSDPVTRTLSAGESVDFSVNTPKIIMPDETDEIMLVILSGNPTITSTNGVTSEYVSSTQSTRVTIDPTIYAGNAIGVTYRR